MANNGILLHLPFTGTYLISSSFGEIPVNPKIISMYKSLGLIGHNGIDYQMPEGTEILSVDDGVIDKIATDVNFGLYITIKHQWGKSLYAHLQKTNVKKADKITTGQLIGLSGKTGFATGPHLHFGIKPNNPNVKNGYFGYIDPALFIS